MSSAEYILRLNYPQKYPEINKAILNFKNVAADFVTVFRKHVEINYEDENKELKIKKIYDIDGCDEELYEQLYKKYQYHCFLVQDLALEMTRALNYIFELSRTYIDPMFRLNEGFLIIDSGTVISSSGLANYIIRVEYNDDDKDLLYQGLKDFMETRAKRSLWKDKGISKDY